MRCAIGTDKGQSFNVNNVNNKKEGTSRTLKKKLEFDWSGVAKLPGYDQEEIGSD